MRPSSSTRARERRRCAVWESAGTRRASARRPRASSSAGAVPAGPAGQDPPPPARGAGPGGRREDVGRAGARVTAEVRSRFEGRVAIVAGAARGVGREIVHAFAEAGARVVAADRDGDGLAETCSPLRETVTAIVADVSTAEGASAIVDQATGTFGRLDVCVNNAA